MTSKKRNKSGKKLSNVHPILVQKTLNEVRGKN